MITQEQIKSYLLIYVQYMLDHAQTKEGLLDSHMASVDGGYGSVAQVYEARYKILYNQALSLPEDQELPSPPSPLDERADKAARRKLWKEWLDELVERSSQRTPSPAQSSEPVESPQGASSSAVSIAAPLEPPAPFCPRSTLWTTSSAKLIYALIADGGNQALNFLSGLLFPNAGDAQAAEALPDRMPAYQHVLLNNMAVGIIQAELAAFQQQELPVPFTEGSALYNKLSALITSIEADEADGPLARLSSPFIAFMTERQMLLDNCYMAQKSLRLEMLEEMWPYLEQNLEHEYHYLLGLDITAFTTELGNQGEGFWSGIRTKMPQFDQTAFSNKLVLLREFNKWEDSLNEATNSERLSLKKQQSVQTIELVSQRLEGLNREATSEAFDAKTKALLILACQERAKFLGVQAVAIAKNSQDNPPQISTIKDINDLIYIYQQRQHQSQAAVRAFFSRHPQVGTMLDEILALRPVIEMLHNSSKEPTAEEVVALRIYFNTLPYKHRLVAYCDEQEKKLRAELVQALNLNVASEATATIISRELLNYQTNRAMYSVSERSAEITLVLIQHLDAIITLKKKALDITVEAPNAMIRPLTRLLLDCQHREQLLIQQAHEAIDDIHDMYQDFFEDTTLTAVLQRYQHPDGDLRNRLLRVRADLCRVLGELTDLKQLTRDVINCHTCDHIDSLRMRFNIMPYKHQLMVYSDKQEQRLRAEAAKEMPVVAPPDEGVSEAQTKADFVNAELTSYQANSAQYLQAPTNPKLAVTIEKLGVMVTLKQQIKNAKNPQNLNRIEEELQGDMGKTLSKHRDRGGLRFIQRALAVLASFFTVFRENSHDRGGALNFDEQGLAAKFPMFAPKSLKTAEEMIATVEAFKHHRKL